MRHYSALIASHKEVTMLHSKTQVRRVYDPLLRALHWVIALSVVALIASSQLAEAFEDGPYETAIWNLHILAGTGLIGRPTTNPLRRGPRPRALRTR